MKCVNEEKKQIECPVDFETSCTLSEHTVITIPERPADDYRIFECSTEVPTIPTPRSGGIEQPEINGFILVLFFIFFVILPVLVLFTLSKQIKKEREQLTKIKNILDTLEKK